MALHLHLVEGWTYGKINEHLGIHDPGRMKRWMRKYREQGEFGLMDQRGSRKEYIVSRPLCAKPETGA
ncbi:helix-turn-helix domain-containing protein [Paenibacillus pabuli]|uniref:helix-turn-helix domain-containing protein n=1 Tax=Paenibacillus pabuli TaxID=1472 RepID=UPI000DB92AB0